jgi:amino acid adenylation domain-containing protein
MITADNNAYILYTSGSTGRPKGVLQNHRNVLYHIDSYIKNLQITENDNLAMFASFGFDAAVMDIFSALLSGSTLTLIDPREMTSDEVSKVLRDHQVTIYHSTPTLLRHFFGDLPTSTEKFDSIRMIVLGGEMCTARDIDIKDAITNQKAYLVNGFGPTESTVTLQYFIDPFQSDTVTPVPIGWPVGNTLVHLMQGAVEKLECFAEGEIVIFSDHVALGYWKQDELTEKSFGLSQNGRRYYRTGDYGIRWVDGSIRPLGRKDNQVKIHGVRIELGEIEAVIREHVSIKDCICLMSNFETGNPILFAVCIFHSEGRFISDKELRMHVAVHLPSVMRPAKWFQIDQIPKTPTGKVDLQNVMINAVAIDDQNQLVYEAPSSDVAIQVCASVATVLGKDRIGLSDSFFDLGGNSLQAMRLMGRIKQSFEIEIPLREMFENPTIRHLIEVVERQLLAKNLMQTPTDTSDMETFEF